MALRLRITHRAAAQIRKADLWWTQHRAAAPGALHDDLDEAFRLLSQQPAIGTPVTHAKLSGVRRLHLGRLHYFLYYRVTGNDIVVLAFWHVSRGAPPSV